MKQILIISMLFFITSVAHAQRVTYEDLKYILYHNIGATEDYLSKKGFTYSGVDHIGNERDTNYVFKKNASTSTDYIAINKTQHNGVFYEVSLFTMRSSDYQKIKDSIRLKGFVSTDTQLANSGSLVKNYKYGKLIFSFLLSKAKDNEDVAEYYITLQDSTLTTF